MVEEFAPAAPTRVQGKRESLVSRRGEGVPPLSDIFEADMVRQHLATFQRRFPDSKHERILRCLISPKSPAAAYSLDDTSLENIFFAVNEMFFDGRLTKRVIWKWSQDSSGPEYESRIAGHTSLRRSPTGRGFETCITLSTPILKDPKYSRRLLISAFLHELIHCYLFICCGFEAKRADGHTEGFREIARIIDDWAGPGRLHLCDMEADLENFRDGRRDPPAALEARKARSSHHDERSAFRPSSAAATSTGSSCCSRGARDDDAYAEQYDYDLRRAATVAMDGAWEVPQQQQPPPSRRPAYDERSQWDYPVLGAVAAPSEAGRGSGPSSYVC